MYRGFVIPMGSGMNMATSCDPMRSRALKWGLSVCIALHLARSFLHALHLYSFRSLDAAAVHA